jgi:hypothetical protein
MANVSLVLSTGSLSAATAVCTHGIASFQWLFRISQKCVTARESDIAVHVVLIVKRGGVQGHIDLPYFVVCFYWVCLR